METFLPSESRQLLQTFLQDFGGEIAHSIRRTPGANDMHVKALKHGRNSLVLSVEIDGTKKLVKSYTKNRPEAVASYIRERDALRALGPIGLGPKLDRYSNNGQFLIMEFVEGFDTRDAIDPDALLPLCRALGQWLGKYARKAPFKRSAGNWFEYLQNYPSLMGSEAVQASRDVLETFWYDRLVLSKNDGALANFMLRDSGEIIGVDFEHAQFKPVGWDLLLTSRAVIRLYPEKTENIIQELADGYFDVAPGRPERFVSLIKIFAISTAFEANSANVESPAMQALHAYNQTADTKAGIVATTPFREAKLQTQDQKTLAVFKAHVTTLAERAVQQPQQIARVSHPTTAAPTPEMAALCTACQGGCCSMGLGKNALIDQAAVAHFQALKPDATIDNLVDAYLDRIPEVHVQGSCFFHGAKGCTLSRDMRSQTCNGYACSSARTLLRRVKDRAPESVLCVAGDGPGFRKATQSIGREVHDVALDRLHATTDAPTGTDSQAVATRF